MTKILKIISSVLLLTFLLLAQPTNAVRGNGGLVDPQTEPEPLVLDFNRDFGYGGFGGEIQGRFSLKVQAPADVARVAYYLDDTLVFEGREPPFRWQFNTAEFPEGRHTFWAIGYTSDGREYHAEPFDRIFLSSDAAWRKTGDLVTPLLIFVAAATVIGVVAPMLLGRQKPHVPGVYGMAGGAICPRCTFPYTRHIFAPNMLVGKLERCPHCGKWAIVPQAGADALQAAEKRLAAEGQGELDVLTEEEKLRRMIEDSRFDR